MRLLRTGFNVIWEYGTAPHEAKDAMAIVAWSPWRVTCVRSVARGFRSRLDDRYWCSERKISFSRHWRNVPKPGFDAASLIYEGKLSNCLYVVALSQPHDQLAFWCMPSYNKGPCDYVIMTTYFFGYYPFLIFSSYSCPDFANLSSSNHFHH